MTRRLLIVTLLALAVAFPARAQDLRAEHSAAVTPSDTVNITTSTWLAFANSGSQTLQVTMDGGEVVQMILPSGMWPIRVKRVWNTGTTVTSIVEFWQ